MNKKLQFTLKLILGILILGIIFYNIGIEQILLSAANVNLIIIPLVIVPTILILGINALNIKILASAYNTKLNIIKMWKYSTLSWLMGLITPGKIGEYSMVYFLKKEGIQIGKSTAMLVIDKTVTLLIMTILTIFAWFKFFNEKDPVIIFLPIMLIVFVVFWLIYTNIGRTFIKKYILRSFSQNFTGFSKSINLFLKKHFHLVLTNLLLTLLRTALAGIAIVLFFHAYGLKNNIIDAVLINNITSFLSLIPITLNGLGITEGISIFFYGLIGFEKEIVAGIYLGMLVYHYILALIFFLFLFKKKT